MGSIMNPVGPAGPRTYWIRRAVVIGVALLVVLGLGWLLAPKPTPAVPEASDQSSAPAQQATTAPPEASAPGSTATGPTSDTSSQPGKPVACEPSALRLTIAGYKQVKVGTRQTFTVSIINGGQASCIVDVNPKSYQLKVVSGKDQIFTTAHCAAWVPAKKVTLKPETSHEFKVRWTLHRSSDKCKLSKDDLKPGTYVATSRYNDVEAKLVMLIK